MLTASPLFWKDKKVLLTGHTGFKGAWMAFWLSKLGAKVTGISLPPVISESNLYTLANIENMVNSYFEDIRNAEAISKIIKKYKPE